MLIDIHAHAFADNIADKAVNQLIHYYNIPTVHGGHLADTLRLAAEAKVDYSVLLVAATKPEQVDPANNWILKIKKYTVDDLRAISGVPNPPRLIPFGTVHPGYPNLLSELERLKAAGLKGIKLHPEFQAFDLDDPRLFPVFEAMGEEMVLMTHVGDENRKTVRSTPAQVLKILRNFPKLRVLAAHMGGYRYWQESYDTLAGHDVYFDVSSTMAFINPDLFRAIIKKHGVDRIGFGSDYPLCSPGEELERLDRIAPYLTDSEKERIYSGTARELLGI
ncbi:MAG TPA: amidohydrolase family protein [Bacillota bacterium]|nr:amidohydrolase family protein [Bacillota bacterium]